ncbi:MAG: DUF4097 domain-containing protein [Treponema sp.]|jgi:DUF4097 and DUF4098 domain-containing protein YvlB|nr:DUF4097 domain-containing protein [Treponema sp.]
MTARTRIFIRFTGILLVLTGSTGLYSKDWRKLVNEETRPLTDINRLVIEYGARDLVFVEGSGENLVIRDFMFRNNRDHYSVIQPFSGGELRISRAEIYPSFFSWFTRTPKSEIYIPPAFQGDFDIQLSSGNVKAESRIATAGAVSMELRSGDARMRSLEGGTVSIVVRSGNLNIDDLRGDCAVELKSGNARIKNMEGGTISILSRSGNLDIDNARGDCTMELRSGNIRMKNLEGGTVSILLRSGNLDIDNAGGDCTVELRSGNITIGSMTGRGSYSTTSGNIKVRLKELSGNQSFDVGSGNITLRLPRGVSYNLDAAAKSGEIKIRDSDLEGFGSSGGIIVKSFGENPVYTIRSRVKSGNFEIRAD